MNKSIKGLTGRIIQPGDPAWQEACIGFALRADYAANVPRVVVFCQDRLDVANAVKWAVKNKVPMRARAGRHNYEGYSSLVKDGIIIDISEMETVKASSSSNEAEIGAGIDMLECFEELNDMNITFPMATGPSVGLAGLTLGGGVGVTTRKFGLTCDNLLEVEMVNAEGEIIIANESKNHDLFWACKGGGGGNFGIATKFKFRVHPVNNAAIFSIGYPWEAFEYVVDKWQKWNFNADWNMSSFIALVGDKTITVQGQYTGTDEELAGFMGVIAPMLSDPSPISVNIQMLPFRIATRIILGVDPFNPLWRVQQHSDNQIFKSTSAFAMDFFSMEAISILKKYLNTVPQLSAPPSQPTMVQLLGGGGFPDQVKPTATAVWARGTKFIVQYDGYWTAPEDGPETMKWVEDLRNELSPHTTGAYVNYSDADIPNYLQQYYGGNLERLVKVKAHYDPNNVFNYPQSIPVSMSKKAVVEVESKKAAKR